MAVFANRASLSPRELEPLRALAGRFRYLLLLDIRRNEVSKEEWTGWEQASDYNVVTGDYDYYGPRYYAVSNYASRRLKCVFVTPVKGSPSRDLPGVPR